MNIPCNSLLQSTNQLNNYVNLYHNYKDNTIGGYKKYVWYTTKCYSLKVFNYI